MAARAPLRLLNRDFRESEHPMSVATTFTTPAGSPIEEVTDLADLHMNQRMVETIRDAVRVYSEPGAAAPPSDVVVSLVRQYQTARTRILGALRADLAEQGQTMTLDLEGHHDVRSLFVAASTLAGWAEVCLKTTPTVASAELQMLQLMMAVDAARASAAKAIPAGVAPYATRLNPALSPKATETGQYL
jgi:hypothetical protein